MIQFSRIRPLCLAFLFGTSLTVPHVAAAQTASGDRLIAVNPLFQPDRSIDLTKKGLSTQSGARQRALRALRNLANVSGFVEQPWVRRGEDAGGDGSGNVLVNDPALDN